MAASIERCPHPQMGRSRHPDIEAFITSMCTQVLLTSNCFPVDNTPRWIMHRVLPSDRSLAPPDVDPSLPPYDRRCTTSALHPMQIERKVYHAGRPVADHLQQ